jgi:hypothetical protein
VVDAEVGAEIDAEIRAEVDAKVGVDEDSLRADTKISRPAG